MELDGVETMGDSPHSADCQHRVRSTWTSGIAGMSDSHCGRSSCDASVRAVYPDFRRMNSYGGRDGWKNMASGLDKYIYGTSWPRWIYVHSVLGWIWHVAWMERHKAWTETRLVAKHVFCTPAWGSEPKDMTFRIQWRKKGEKASVGSENER